MDNINELYAALSKAQSEFKTPKKDKKAHYGMYASIGSINEAVRDPMTKNGLSIIQPIVTMDSKVYVKTLITHQSGAYIESILPIPDIPQNTKNYFHILGSAITYLRRYSLQSMLGVSADDVEDDGDSLNDVKVHQTITDVQCNQLIDSYNLLNSENKQVAFNALKGMGVKEFQQIKPESFKGYLQLLSSLVDRQAKEFHDEVKDV